MSKTLICVVGPTAIGKTALGIYLAQHFNTDVVSADSRQFYKEMEIGTAVPSSQELSEAKHHFIQNISITENYSVGDFEKDALHTLNSLFKVKEQVIVVGGSGLYVDAVTRGLDHFPKVDATIRNELNSRLEKEGLEALQTQLKQLDPEYYAKVDLQNPHRVIRALEISIGSGQPYSSFLKKSENNRPFKSIYVGLKANRALIYERINQRVDLMIENGLVEEARKLFPNRHRNALNTVGYKELFDFFDGKCTLEEAIANIKTHTRRFAKRQLTWYRKRDDIVWFDIQTPKKQIIKAINKKMQ